MAPIKQEEHIKDTLEQRNLQPTSQAWSQLVERLDKEEKKKSTSAFWWIGIAASIVLVITITFPFLNNETKTKQPIIVDIKTDIIKEKPTNTTPIIKIPENKNNVTVTTENKMLEPTTEEESKSIEKIIHQSQKTIVKHEHLNKTSVLADTPKNTSEKIEIEDTPLNTLKTIEDIKVLDVVAEIQKMKDTPSGVSDREIDSLLKVAHKEILTQRLYNQTNNTVDANLLLQDVEADLEQSFRSRVFEALKSNYKKVKTAVAERNN